LRAQNFVISGQRIAHVECALCAHQSHRSWIKKVDKTPHELEMCRYDKTVSNACAWFWCNILFSVLLCNVQLSTVEQVLSCHDTWPYRGSAIYRDHFDTGIETSVLTKLIKVSRVSHNT